MPTGASPETAQRGAGAGIIGDLLEEVADYADLDGLGQKLRRGPVEVEVDAVLVLKVRVRQAVGQARDDRELLPAFGSKYV
jgi:hypothetical protein